MKKLKTVHENFLNSDIDIWENILWKLYLETMFFFSDSANIYKLFVNSLIKYDFKMN